MSTEPAEPVSAHPSLWEGRPTLQGGPGVEGTAGSPLVRISALGYPSGLAGPSDISAHGREQLSSSQATGVDVPASSLLAAAAPYQQQLALRQPPAAATETPAAEGLTLAMVLCPSVSVCPSVTSRCSTKTAKRVL